MTQFEIECHDESLLSNSKSPSQSQDEEDNNNNNNKYQEEKEKEEDQEGHHKGRIVLSLSKQPDSGASTSSSPSSNKHHNKVEEEEEEENDGFRTPTSLDHRIPVSKQCPPAPRKLSTKPSLKRKPSSSSSSSSQSSLFSCSRSHPLDLSKEVELLFPTTQHNHQLLCTKKVRRERNPCDA